MGGFLAGVVAAVLASAIIGAPGAARAEPVDSSQIEVGRALYEDKCAQCHGLEGDGAGIASGRLDPRPRDFTSGAFKIRTTPSGELPTDEDIVNVIRGGMPYTAMPAWPSLSDRQIASLVAYIETFNEDFSDPEMRIPPIEIPAAPPMTNESRERGREVYRTNKCFDCHGGEGRGDGLSAPTLTDDWGQPIRPADLTKRWTFRGGSRREDIYRTFTTGLNGTPMPSYADSIPEEERWQLVDYVYSLSSDDPDYGDLVVAVPVEGEIELDPRSPLFDEAVPTRLPVVGQVTDPGREFTPATNGVELRAVYDADHVAIQVSWHAMRAQPEGSNRPDGRSLPPEGAAISDAAAIQVPAESSTGPARPYFLYGDTRRPVDLWFYDAAEDAARVYRGKGEANLSLAPSEAEAKIRAKGVFEDGRWRVVFLADREPRGEDGEAPRFREATFVPIALSIWAGHAGETGNRRGITSWYNLYLAPPKTSRAYVMAGTMAFVTLAAELMIVAGVRRAHRQRNTRED